MFLYIVTVHLNNLTGLINTGKSLKNLLSTYDECVWLIKDGLSERDCIDKIESAIQDLPDGKVILVSQQDSGIYDAMNQAINMMKDESAFGIFLNSGDCITEEFISKLDYFKQLNKNFDIIYGDYRRYIGSRVYTVKSAFPIDFAYLVGKTINHQSIFIKVKWLKKYPFITEFRIVADWVQLFTLFREIEPAIHYLDYPVALYEGGGVSEVNHNIKSSERIKFLHKVYSTWELDSLMKLHRIRTKNWLSHISRVLDSPKKTKIFSVLLNIISR